MKKNTDVSPTKGIHAYAKKLFSIVAFLIMTAISSCEDEPGRASLDVPLFVASRTEIIIDESKPATEAISFSWHVEKTPTIEYQLVFTAGPQSGAVDASSETHKSLTNVQLNKILVDDLQLKPGEPATVTVEVQGKVTDGSNTGVSNPITISVTPATFEEPPLETILAISKSAATIDLINPSGETVTLSWADTKSGLILFSLLLSTDTKTATVDAQTDISKEFTNAELNEILINQLQLEVGKMANVNVQLKATGMVSGNSTTSNTVTFSVTPAPAPAAPAHNKLWIVGNATPNGWDIGNPNAMVNDPTNIYQFKFNELNAGEFKIPVTTGNWGCDYYMPPVNLQTISSTDVKFTPGGNPDNKWLIENTGAYKMTLNISSSPSIKFTPFTPYAQIYIVGDATSAGWVSTDAIAMTVDENNPNVFTWTGELTSTGRGQFRFLVATDDLDGSSFMAPSANAGITATQLAFATSNASVNNFKVKTGEDGIYKVTVNQLKETISIVKQ
jgi:hypothetical protein